MNIIIIDDNNLTTRALEHYLNGEGHTTHIATDAEEAISKIIKGNFDIVISDIMMPGISGLSLVNVLRSVHLCYTPVIMMSSLSNSPLVEAALKAGANDFITKPLVMEELSAKLKKFDPIKQ